MIWDDSEYIGEVLSVVYGDFCGMLAAENRGNTGLHERIRRRCLRGANQQQGERFEPRGPGSDRYSTIWW